MIEEGVVVRPRSLGRVHRNWSDQLTIAVVIPATKKISDIFFNAK